MSPGGRDLEPFARLEANLLAVAARGRETVDVGPFRAFFAADSPDYLLSLATPVAVPDGWAVAIDRLDDAFAARDRRPRLEYFQERFPTLADALTVAGYVEDASAPVMVLCSDGWRGAGVSVDRRDTTGVRTVSLSAAGPDLVDAFLAMQGRAYGMDFAASDGGWRARLLEGLRDGSVIGSVQVAGEAVLSGAVLLLGGGSAELAGVATEPHLQGRGHARQACTALLARYFAAGNDLCWLSAAEGAEGLYRRLGFRRAGTQRNYGRPATNRGS